MRPIDLTLRSSPVQKVEAGYLSTEILTGLAAEESLFPQIRYGIHRINGREISGCELLAGRSREVENHWTGNQQESGQFPGDRLR